jgi:hypothetical protein
LGFFQWREVIAAGGLVADEIPRLAAVIDGVAGVIIDADDELFLAPIFPEVCQLIRRDEAKCFAVGVGRTGSNLRSGERRVFDGLSGARSLRCRMLIAPHIENI